ncbi:hypothetical protein AKJ09_03526 [Labilithrix luteola]|uniref:Uncharacterized protein n=1 Tax=Labilithrix luteola TaxID=1391654 RepID=A0A0K1PTL7_9BACT|nr:hypothetical protein [Labilithrix luteola]AKU96862.1 hypothetical protein AKJ09_03526 [Labilithrix luteola]
MYVVALVTLGRSADEEASSFASDLGITPYEAGLVLRGALPAIVLRTDVRERAIDLLGKLRARSHETVAFDASHVVASDAMAALRSFRFEADAFVNVAGSGAETRLPYADLFAIVRATHVTSSVTVEKRTERKLSIGRAALTGGLMPSRTSTKETKHTTEEREFVLYLFRNDGPPWIVRASKAHYEGLGPSRSASTPKNFQQLVKRLREAAPHAIFDERLLAIRGTIDPSSASKMDLLAHVVALSLSQRQRAYRST